MYEKNENEPLPRREATLKNYATPSETKSRRLQYLKKFKLLHVQVHKRCPKTTSHPYSSTMACHRSSTKQ
jgi:hypothetical protein